MKRRTVMPDVEAAAGPPSGDVRHDPLDAARGLAEPRPRRYQRALRDVENGNRLPPRLDQGVDQPRCAAAYVDDGRCRTGADKREKLQRDGRPLLEPADTCLTLGLVGGVPMIASRAVAHGSFLPRLFQ